VKRHRTAENQSAPVGALTTRDAAVALRSMIALLHDVNQLRGFVVCASALI